MKRLLFVLIYIILFTGCIRSQVHHITLIDKNKLNTQYIEHQECRYLIGPFSISDDVTMEQIVETTIQKANDQGMYGNELINIKIEEGISSIILFTKLCIYVKGNLVTME